ncbi:hypothetical protein PSPO01_04320 [Paraphaeosphaeria sporulosa]
MAESSRHHRVPRKEADSIAEEVGRWAGLIQYASQLEVPCEAVDPTGQLPVYTDGLMCQLELERCHQVYQSEEAMRKHWQKAHHWSPATRGGRPSQAEQKRIALRSKQRHRHVHYQRLFVQGIGSQYSEVHRPESTPEPMDSDTAWARVVRNMDQAWARVKKRAETTIQNGARDEVEPVVGADRMDAVFARRWKGANQYPPILSAVIKVARFMIVQQALELSELFKDDVDGNSTYKSDSKSTP